MKTSILCILFVIVELIIAIAATSAEIHHPAVELTRVELFRNGAQVYKTVVFQADQTQNMVIIRDIPSDIDPSTIRAKALGNQKINSIEFKTDYAPDPEHLKLNKMLKDSIEDLSFEMALIESDLQSLQQREALLDQNKSIYVNGLGTDELKKLLEVYSNELRGIKREIVQLNRQLLFSKEEARKLRIKLQANGQIQNDLAGIIYLDVTAAPQRKNEVQISYLVADAWWNPKYDVRVKDITDPMVIDYRAEVFQNSGEDWNDVELKLMISNPMENSTLLELKTWALGDGLRPPDYRQLKNSQLPPSMMAANKGAAIGAVTDASTQEPIPFANVIINQNGSTVAGASSDLEGLFEIKPLAPGYYDLYVQCLGYSNIEVKGIRIVGGQATTMNPQMTVNAVLLSEVQIQQLPGVVATDINKMAMRNPASLASTAGGVYTADDGSGSINVRGQRSSSNYYYIDGNRVKSIKPEPIEHLYLKDEGPDEELNVEFEAYAKQSLPSSKKPRSVFLQSKEVEANYIFRAIPKVDLHAYLYAEVPEWEGLGLLSAPVKLYYQNTYIGETKIDATKPEDTLSLSLGPDKNIRLERERVKTESKSPNFGMASNYTTWEIKIQSRKNYPINLKLEDQIPVSIDDEYEVNLSEQSIATLDEGSGILTWEFELAAMETTSRAFSYEVRFPKGARVSLE